MPNRAFRAAAVALAALASLGIVAAARAETVDLELVLAVDVSGSIDPEEAKLQRQGYVAAFLDPEVLRAIQGGYNGAIAVTYFEWAGQGWQRPLVGWQVIRSADDARAFAALLADADIRTGPFTSISGAIDFAAPLFDANDVQGIRRVIDISGDGENNSGAPVVPARDRAVAQGITINGLPIVNDRPSRFGGPPSPDLDVYYERCVIGGPGAFLVVATDFPSFGEAIRRKLILEIAGTPPATPAARLLHRAGLDRGVELAQARSGAEAPYDCNIGFRRMYDYYRQRGPT